MLKKAWEMYRPFRKHLKVLLLFTFAQQLLNLINPFLQGKVADAVISRNESAAIDFGFLALAFYLAANLLTHKKDDYEIQHLDFAVNHHITRSFIERMMEYSIGQHKSENSGLKMGILMRGQSSIAQLTNTILYHVLPQILVITIMTVGLIFVDQLLGLILAGGILTYAAWSIWENLKMRPELEELEEAQVKEGKRRSEVLYNLPLVMRNAQEERAVGECDSGLSQVSERGRSIWGKMSRRGYHRHLFLTLVRMILLGSGAWLVYSGKHTPGYLFIFWSWSDRALNSIGEIGRLQRQLADQWSGAKKCLEMLAIEPDVRDVENPVVISELRGEVVFDNVTYAYPQRHRNGLLQAEQGDRSALHGVSFRVRAGERIALVGESGAGKSTIVALLLREQDPQEGNINIDGHDLRMLKKSHFRSRVGVVEQDVALFDETLGYNLRYGLNGQNDFVSKDDLAHVCRVARVDRFFEKLEHGFDTLIGERGVKLSGGEKQRVGIARALLKNPAILVLDEATSSLDAENEALIQEALEEASRGRTTFVIAHRFSTIRHVDRIFVVDQGRIVASGTHAELAESSPHYQRLMRHQRFL